jgi:hypothetical protein
VTLGRLRQRPEGAASETFVDLVTRTASGGIMPWLGDVRVKGTKMRAAASLVAVTIAATGLTVLAQAPAQALGSRTVPLPVDSVEAVAFDEATGHLFISTGWNRSEVLVTDVDGSVVRRIDGLPGAAGMLLDGGRLYVALRDGEAIAAIDTSTLVETQRWPLPAGICPDELAMTVGQLVFSTKCSDPLIRTSLGVLDRATGAASLLETAMLGAMLTANAASNGRVAVAEKYSSTSEVGVYDVSSGQVEFVTAATDFQNINRIGDLAMAPDGQSVFVSAGDGFLLPLDSLTFQPVASSNVAVWSGDGRQLVLGTSESLAVWPVDSTASQSMWIGPYPYGGAGHGRLAVDPTATRGWVVSAGIGGLDPPTLVLYDLTPSGTQWTLSAARTVLPENSPVTIQADLMIGGQPAPDGTAVIISSTRPDGGGRTETYYTRDGGITISSLALRGSSRYRFHYWDATNGGAEAYSDVIGTYETALYVLEPLSPSHPGRPLAWFGRLTDTFNNALPGRLVDLVRSDGGAGTVVDTAATDFDGWFRLEDTPDAVGVYTYTVRYAGDEAAAPAEHETVITVEKYTGYVGVEAWLGTGRDKRTATVLGSLSGYHTNPILTITATPDGGKPTVIAQGPVADDNTLTARYLMKRATTFTVSHAGDDWYTPAEASTRLLPR